MLETTMKLLRYTVTRATHGFIVVDAHLPLPRLLHPVGRHSLLQMAQVLLCSLVVLVILELVHDASIHRELLRVRSELRHLLIQRRLHPLSTIVSRSGNDIANTLSDSQVP